ncbi:MAG: sugar O-acetyltransferase [Clostridium sp.]
MKSEKQKMLDGDLYVAFGEFGDSLFKERQHAKVINHKYNNMIEDIDGRNKLLKDLLGGIGEKFFVEPPFRCDYGYNIFIGENFYSNYNLVILDCAKVTIGDNVLIGPNVNIFGAGHPVHEKIRNAGYEYAFPVTIGDNVWIGGGTNINANVTIGENTVIGSGSVVTKDIPANVIAAGNPCRVIREITDEDLKYYFKGKLIGDLNLE